MAQLPLRFPQSTRDTFTGSISLLGCDIHYIANRLGSLNETDDNY
jgi:hypothetical protein